MEVIERKEIVKIRVLVESDNVEGAYYIVTKESDKWTCSCPSFKYRAECKHIDRAKEEVD